MEARDRLLKKLGRLAQVAVQGTLVEVRLRCGTKSCGCHRSVRLRHGPHLYLKYRTPEGRSTGLYVPRAHERQARGAVQAWEEMWQALVELSERNREELRGKFRRRRDAKKGR